MPGETSFRPNVDDYIAAARVWYMHALRKPRFSIRLSIITALVAFGGVLITWDDSSLGYRLLFVFGMMAGFLILMTMLMLISYALLPRRATRLFRQQRTLEHDFVFRWDDAGTDTRSDVGTSMIAWTDYHAWAEGRAAFIFFLNDQLYHFIPKRALSPDQLVDLRTSVQAARAGG
ncbi:MAG: YcxB family protein [Pseudomonadota bacterium]|uniref:YcxB family protein n=1 Tax=Sphingomonas sp. ERG5 TaxID=1381597 RepID=UPI00054C7826|nr:YcxB family protein [Sphingomonas sp. ERG5]